MNDPPIEIEGLPIVQFRRTVFRQKESRIWEFYANDAERNAEGLRIELCMKPDGSSEVRLVRGPWSSPKHLHVIRLRGLNLVALNRAVVVTMKHYRAKGG